MKHTIFYTWERTEERHLLVDDIKDSVLLTLEHDWRMLQTPILLDIDLVDVLMINKEGQLCVVKIIENEDLLSLVGTLARDYVLLQSKLDRIGRAYPNDYIDIKKKLLVKLFAPHSDDLLQNTFSCINFPLEVFHYSFIRSHTNSGILVKKIPTSISLQHGQEYSSLLKIMGENVRSDTSQVNPDELNLVDAEGLVETKETFSPEIVPPVTDEEHTLQHGKLNEEELVAFFELEKKIDESRNN